MKILFYWVKILRLYSKVVIYFVPSVCLFLPSRPWVYLLCRITDTLFSLLMSIPLNVNTLLFPFKIKSIYIYRNWHRFNLLAGLLDPTSILPFKFTCFIRCRLEKFCEQGLQMLLICLSNSYLSKAYKIFGGPNLTVLVWHYRVSMTIFDLFYVLNLPVHCQNK